MTFSNFFSSTWAAVAAADFLGSAAAPSVPPAAATALVSQLYARS